MSRSKRWLIALLTLIALALIGWNMADNAPSDAPSVSDPRNRPIKANIH